MTAALTRQFAQKIIDWQLVAGRHGLPWQNTRDPYKVWLSEIMLQQTQVVTVIGFYQRFLDRFPAVAALANAPLDDVLALWSGLGYYSRARNLHRCAQDVVALHGGQFPKSAQLLQTLPGIGPSTAAAIAAFCFAERVAIFDGNVKRVLSRLVAYSADLAVAKNAQQLWAVATDLLPKSNLARAMPQYTQAIMDLGATLCTTRKPQCVVCPVQALCKGFATGQPSTFPIKTKKLRRSANYLSLLWAKRSDGSVWLERRPVPGVWGGLHCFPIFESEPALLACLLPRSGQSITHLPQFKHVLTHKDLHLSPIKLELSAGQQALVGESAAAGRWFSAAEWPGLGLPAPVRKLLESEPLQPSDNARLPTVQLAVANECLPLVLKTFG